MKDHQFSIDVAKFLLPVVTRGIVWMYKRARTDALKLILQCSVMTSSLFREERLRMYRFTDNGELEVGKTVEDKYQFCGSRNAEDWAKKSQI